MKAALLILYFVISLTIAWGQFPPPAGQPGSDAISADSLIFNDWAQTCLIERGFLNIADTSLGYVSFGNAEDATGTAGDGMVVSLGDHGSALLTFSSPVVNGPGSDFAVFENGLNDTFLELAFVEVSSDGMSYFRFPAVSLTDTNIQVSGYGSVDATKIHNLAGKYRTGFGTPFDLDELTGISGLDVMHVTHIRIVDVIGSIDSAYATHDSQGNRINDPWPTAFPSGGFDLDAVGIIHSSAGIGEAVANMDFEVFPNPSSHYIHVKPKYTGNGVICLYTIDGLAKKEWTYNSPGGINLDISDITSGLYFLKYTSGNKVAVKKLIVTGK